MVACEEPLDKNTDPNLGLTSKEFLSSGEKNREINEIRLIKIDPSSSDDESNYVPTICNTMRYNDTYSVIAKITNRFQDPENQNICELNYYDAPRLLIDAEIMAVAYGHEVPKNLRFSALAEWNWGSNLEVDTEQLLFLNKINEEWFLIYALLLHSVDDDSVFLSTEETDIPPSFEEYVKRIEEMKLNRIEYCNQDYYDEDYLYENLFNPYDDQGMCKWQ